MLVDLDYPIHLVLTQHTSTGQGHVVGVALVDWKKVLHSGRISTLVELNDPYHPQMSVGILDILIEFLPIDGDRARRDEIDYHVRPILHYSQTYS